MTVHKVGMQNLSQTENTPGMGGGKPEAAKLQSRWAGHLVYKLYKERVDKAAWGRAWGSRSRAAGKQLLNGRQNEGATYWSPCAGCFPKVGLFNVRTFSLCHRDVKTEFQGSSSSRSCKWWVQDSKPGQSYPRSHCHSSLVTSSPFLKVNSFVSKLFSLWLMIFWTTNPDSGLVRAPIHRAW